MSNLRQQIIRLASERPETRKYLVPLLQKYAMEFPSEEARKKYLKEHPKADPRKHTVKKPSKPSNKGKEVDFQTFERKNEPQEKDFKRIRDLIRKAPSHEKAVQLAQNMAKSITDAGKAYRRGRAAEEDNYHSLAEIFFNRAEALWAEKHAPKTETAPKKPAPKKEAPKQKSKPTPKFKKNYPKPVKTVMTAHGLTDDDADQIKEFKKKKPNVGGPVTPAVLLQRFLAKAKPETRKRMKNVTPAEFMKMLAAIMNEEGVE